MGDTRAPRTASAHQPTFEEHTVNEDNLIPDQEPGPAKTEWPTSALAAAEHAFGFLIQPSAQLCVDGRQIGHGLPARDIDVDELRYLLVHDPDTSFDAKDACWHHLIERARTGDPGWVLAAVAMALPALANMARRLRVRFEAQSEDIDSELLTGFLDSLRHADLSGPAPYARMCWAGWRAARLARGPRHSEELPDLFDPASRLPTRPYGHPDLILGRAVAAGVITADQAELISATRFDHVFLYDLAARQGVDPAALRMRRRRSELAVARALVDGALDPGPRSARVAGRRIRAVSETAPLVSGRVRFSPRS